MPQDFDKGTLEVIYESLRERYIQTSDICRVGLTNGIREAAKIDLIETTNALTKVDRELAKFYTPEKESFKTKLSLDMGRFGVTSNDVIKATGIDQSVFSKIKTGEREPSKESYEKLIAYFGKLSSENTGYVEGKYEKKTY